MSVESMVSASKRARYGAAIEGQRLGFVDLRTPPDDLPRDARGIVVLPPVQLFGDDVRPRTAEVLSGLESTTWGWP